MKDIVNMSILITGGGSGLGRGAAEYFCKLGAKVTICGRRLEKIEQAAHEIGKNCLGVQADITDAASRKMLIERAVEHGKGLHALTPISKILLLVNSTVQTNFCACRCGSPGLPSVDTSTRLILNVYNSLQTMVYLKYSSVN